MARSEADDRWEHTSDGVWRLADDEPLVALAPAQKRELDKLAAALWERWRSEGATPWTLINQVRFASRLPCLQYAERVVDNTMGCLVHHAAEA